MAKLGGYELAWIGYFLGHFQGGGGSKDLRENMSHTNPKRNFGERVVHVCVSMCAIPIPTHTYPHPYLPHTHPPSPTLTHL